MPPAVAAAARTDGYDRTSIRFGAVAVLLAMTLAGCGVRGALDSPGAKKAAGSGAVSTATKAPGEPAEKPKHRDFVLDGLIR